MKIKEKYTNIESTSAISSYLHQKLSHLEKFISQNTESALCDIELAKTTNHHKNGDIFKAEINLSVSGNQYRVVSEEPDLYAAIDIAKDSMVRELQTNKDKKVSLARRGGAKIKNLIKGIFE